MSTTMVRMSPRQRQNLPTSDQLATWRAFYETFEAVSSRIESRLQRDVGLSTGDYKVLLALSEAEGRALRSSDLADHIGWERSRLSGHLGRMEKRGLVRRERCEEDARGSRIILDDAGADAFRTSTLPHLQAIKEVFVDALTPTQLTQLSEASEAMRSHLGESH